MAQMQAMQSQYDEMAANLNHAHQVQAEIEEMFDNGLIKKAASGKYVVVENARERESIRQQSEAKKKEARRKAQNFDQQSQRSGPNMSAQDLNDLLDNEDGMD